MATFGLALRQKQNADRESEYLAAAMKRERDMVEIPYEWCRKQTDKAVLFPSYGWVPKVALRWKRNAEMLPYDRGTTDDAFYMDREFAERRQKTH